MALINEQDNKKKQGGGGTREKTGRVNCSAIFILYVQGREGKR